MNALLVVSQDSGCAILDTSRLYDAEAENIFGLGHLSLLVHVEQNISVISEESIEPDTVTGIVASGYEIATGGQRVFLNCLNQYDSFQTVLSVELKRGLSSEEPLPTPSPSRATLQPTRKITPDPTVRPSASPTTEPPVTEPPVAIVTRSPSASPTKAPSLPPTVPPTVPPSVAPRTEWPSGYPSIAPTIAPTRIPTTAPTLYAWNAKPISVFTPVQQGPSAPVGDSVITPDINRKMSNATSDPLVIAAIAGATATVVVSCIFAVCIWWRRRRPFPKRRSQPKHALSSKLSKGDPKDMIPGFVELDQRSLADTTLGERTAGWPRPKSTKKPSPPKNMRPVESFDENSLYTTPFSVQRDEVASYHQSYTGPSILASQVIRQREYNGNMLAPLSDSTTTSSDGVSSFGPSSARISADGSHVESSSGIKNSDFSQAKGPIDVDTQGVYLQKGRRSDLSPNRSNERMRAQMAFQAIDERSAVLDMDVWSCDYEDFDRGSDFYEGEARSRSPSHSSRSTTKMKNLSSVLIGGNEVNNSSRSQTSEDELAEQYRGIQGGKERPNIEMTSQDKSPELSKNHMNSWSSWSSRMLQDGVSKRTDANRLEPPEEGGEYRSPLSKLLDSVTQVVSPLHSTRSIPAVTPEETETDVDQTTDTSLSREDDSTLLGLQFKDEASTSSDSTSISAFLFEKVEESLGPKSVTADMDSLSGRSNLSMKSPGNRSKAGSMASFGSRKSYRSTRSTSFSHSDISFAPRTLEHDLKRLGKQLAALDNDVISTSSAGVSSITNMSHAKSAVSSRGRGGPKVSRKKRIVVAVPPGKLGVILANRHDGKGTVVSEIRESSPLFRMLSPGDKLVGVDDDDVADMVVSQITSLMASRADRERRLTIITSVAQQYSK
jgi:hypothetical protein